MCTVGFLPSPDGGYLLGHNRDESVARSRGVPPQVRSRDGRRFLAPTDPDSGGSWIGVNEAGLTLCLLNAAERDASRLPASPRSRGLVLWEALDLESIAAVTERIAHASALLEEVRAFHLVVAEKAASGGHARVGRLRWDGVRSSWDSHEGACLFVSSSLDPDGVERVRGASWRGFLAEGGPRDLALDRWLRNHDPERGPLSVCMHRPDARTVSRTLIEVSRDLIEMRYLDGSPCEPTAAEIRARL